MGLFPNIDLFLHGPMLVDPPMCKLVELQDGTYSIDDLVLMHEMIEYKGTINASN